MDNKQQLLATNTNCENYKLCYLAMDDKYNINFDDPLIKRLIDNFVSQDIAIFEALEHRRQSTNEMLVGDILILKDGTKLYMAHNWGDIVQTSNGGGSYYLCESGNCSYSGGFEDSYKPDQFQRTKETGDLYCWIFSNNIRRAHNAVRKTIKVAIWKEI